MEQPLISVIMPSYNHSQYVVHALDSVLSGMLLTANDELVKKLRKYSN